jgi:hypothetical protein
MATTVDKLLIRVEADMKDLKRSLASMDKNVKRSTQNAERSFNKFGSAVKGVLASVVGIAAVNVGKSFVKLASDANEMQSKSEVVFGKYINDVREFATEMGAATGRSAIELEAMASTVQDTFVPLGFARGEGAKLSMQLTSLATDVASFNNQMDVEVMRNFQSALIGNHETVRKYGIVITEVELQNELLRMGITKSKDEITAQEKVQARLNLIMAGTTDAQGDAIRTAGSFENRMKALTATFQESAITLTSQWLPALADMVEAFRKSLGTMFNGMANFASNVEAFVADIQTHFDKIKIAMTIFAATLIPKMIVAVKALTAVLMRNPFAVMMVALIAMIARWKEIRVLIKDGIPSALKLLQLKFVQFGGSVGSVFSDLWRIIEGTFKTGINSLIDKLNFVVENWNKVREKFGFDAINLLSTYNIEVDNSTEANGKLKKKIAELSTEYDKLNKAFKTNLELAGKKVTIESLKKGAVPTEDLPEDAVKEVQEIKTPKQMKALKKRVEEFEDLALGEVGAKMKDFQETMAELKQSYIDGEISVETYNAAAKNLKTSMTELREEAEINGNELKQMAHDAKDLETQLMSAAVNGVQSLEDNLVELSMGTKSVKEAFADMARSIIRDLIRIQIQQNITSKISSFLGTIFGPSSASVGGGGNFNATNLGHGTGMFAGGGAVSRGRGIVVGERGPELFIPNTSGTVKNNADSQRMVGGGSITINQTLNVEAGVSQTVRAEMLELMPTFKQESIAAVLDAKQRGGGFSEAFGG